MRYRTLGRTGVQVSELGLGGLFVSRIGGDRAQATAAVDRALDLGVNWVDTAPIYGSGHSEEVVGRALKRLPASRRPLVFTKFGLGVNVDFWQAVEIRDGRVVWLSAFRTEADALEAVGLRE